MAKFAAKDSNKNITLSPHGTGKVVVGTGAADATVQSDGNHNLVLQTGNATTGSISITDGADGDIAISPNGTGTVVVNTDLDVDNININGNAITSTNTDGNIDLTPNGTGEVNISKVDIDSGTIDGTTIATSDVEIGSGKTLDGTGTFDVQNGTFTTSPAQKQAIVNGGQTNQLVPANLVAYRASGQSTPSGWSEYTSVRGRMIVGLPSGGTDGGTVGSAFSNQQDKSKDISHNHNLGSHTHKLSLRSDTNAVEIGSQYGTHTKSKTGKASGVGDSGSVNMDLTDGPSTNTSGAMSANSTVSTSEVLGYIQLMAIKKD